MTKPLLLATSPPPPAYLAPRKTASFSNHSQCELMSCPLLVYACKYLKWLYKVYKILQGVPFVPRKISKTKFSYFLNDFVVSKKSASKTRYHYYHRINSGLISEGAAYFRGEFYIKKGFTILIHVSANLLATFTCFLGVKISRNVSALLRRTIFSLNINLIPGVRYKFFNNDLSSSIYSLVFFTVEIYNDLCYITGVFRCCTYSPRHTCCTFVWCNVNIVYRS